MDRIPDEVLIPGLVATTTDDEYRRGGGSGPSGGSPGCGCLSTLIIAILIIGLLI